MRRLILVPCVLVFALASLCGCGPKPTDAEKNTPPPESAKNPRGYTPPPAGAIGSTPPPGAPAGSGR